MVRTARLPIAHGQIKENLVYPNSGTLHRDKTEWRARYDTTEDRRERSQPQKAILCDCIYLKCPEKPSP